MSNTLVNKWAAVLDHEGLPKIKDEYRKIVTAQLLENTEIELLQSRSGMTNLNESNPTMTTDGGITYASTGTIKGFDSVLMGLVRRNAPNLMAYDLCGVQAMKTPASMIFALRSRYVDNATKASWTEALFNEADTSYSGTGTHGADLADAIFPLDSRSTDLTFGTGMATDDAESLGASGGTAYKEMGISIEKVTATAKSRALKANWSIEIQQDLQNVHGENAQNILSNMLSTEIVAEQNRELARLLYKVAKKGCATGQVATAGTFDLDVDSGGRWFKEKIIGLMYQIDREANVIAKETRRGRGNIVVCSSDVASALAMAGLVDNAGLKSENLKVDDTGNLYCGVLNSKYDLYIDPYYNASAVTQFVLIGYKGPTAEDAGIFYCPYVPLTMTGPVTDPATLQQVIGFKARYAIVANPFAAAEGSSGLSVGANVYYRIFGVSNII